MSAPQLRQLGVGDIKAALREILDTMYHSEHATEMDQARRAAGNDMMKMMLVVFPLACKLQMAVIAKYGLSPDGEGLIRFTHAVKAHEQRDAEVAALYSELRSLIMPHMTATAPAAAATTLPASALDRV